MSHHKGHSFAVANGAFAGFAVAFTTATGHFDYLLRFRYSGEPLDSRIDSFGGGNKILQLLASEAIPMIRGASGFTKRKRRRQIEGGNLLSFDLSNAIPIIRGTSGFTKK